VTPAARIAGGTPATEHSDYARAGWRAAFRPPRTTPWSRSSTRSICR